MKPALIIFDLDGTLVDTAPDIARALAVALEPTGVAPPPVETIKRMVGDGSRELVRRALAGGAADPAREAAVLDRYLASYHDNVCVASRPYAGVAEGLAALRADGVALAVVTNKTGDLARTLLATLGLAGALGAIVGDGDGFPRKPDPTAARAILSKAGASPARTVVIGDGLPDVRLGRALGATTIAAAWGYVAPAALRAEGPTFIAASFAEAMAFIRGARG